MMSRRRIAVATVGLVVLASAGGYVAGSKIQSPAEVAARTAPPIASPILVPAEQRLLQTDIVTRGTARFDAPRVVSVAASLLKPDPGVITTLPVLQEQLGEGALTMAASGRPVFLLQGPEPMYRDLGPGTEGQDVMQLEEALARLGHDPGPVDGVYDLDTGVAVAAWYLEAGWQPFEATTEQLAAIRALRQDEVAARGDSLAADDSVAGAAADLAAARAALTGVRAAAAAAPLDVDAARAEATAANQVAALEVSIKTVARDALRNSPGGDAERVAADQAVRLAGSELGAAKGAAQTAAEAAATALLGIDAATAEANSSDQAAAAQVAAQTAIRDAVYADPTSTPAERAAADSDVDISVAAANATQIAGRVAVQSATDAHAAALRDIEISADKVVLAEADLADAQALQAMLNDPARIAADLAAAEADLAAAQAAAEATRIAGEAAVRRALDAMGAAEADADAAASAASAADQHVSTARTQRSLLSGVVGQVAADLALAELQAGVQVPADEVIFLSSVPVRIEQLDVALGDILAGPVFTATQLQLAIDTSLPLDEAPLITAGMPVEIDEPSLGIRGTGSVRRIADTPGTDGVDGFHVYVEILIDEAPASIVGTSVRLTIPIESTGGATLAVPVSALVLAADGTSRVQVQRADGLVFVGVEPGLSAGGFVAVVPVGGELAAGDLVVIGFDQTAVPSA